MYNSCRNLWQCHSDRVQEVAHPSCIACMLIPACRYDTSTLFIMAFAAGSSLSLHLVMKMPRRSVNSCICGVADHAWHVSVAYDWLLDRV